MVLTSSLRYTTLVDRQIDDNQRKLSLRMEFCLEGCLKMIPTKERDSFHG